MGPIGMSKGLLMHLGDIFVSIAPKISKALGMPEWMGLALSAVLFGAIILIVTVSGVYISVNHVKQD